MALIELIQVRSLSQNFLTVCFGLALFSVFCLIAILLKHMHTRNKYSGIPGPKYRLFDFLGSVHIVPWTKKARNGLSLQAIVLQLSQGHGLIYSKETIYRIWFSFHHITLAHKPEAVQAVLRDSSWREKPFFYIFMESLMGRGLINSNGKQWRTHRRMMNPSFHLPVLMNYLPNYNEHASKLVNVLKKLADGGIVELMKPISLCVLDISGDTILGTNLGAQDDGNKDYVIGLRSSTQEIFKRMLTPWHWPAFIFRLTDEGKKFYHSVNIVRNLTVSIFRQKKKEYLLNEGLKSQDQTRSIMDQLLEFHMEQKNVTEQEVYDQVDTFVAASNETTSTTLTFTLYLLGRNKNIQYKVQQELDRVFGNEKERSVTKEDLAELNYLECVIKESMRLFPSVPVIVREVPAKKNSLCGYKLPPFSSVVVSPFLLHRDPEIYPNPEVFDPTRFFHENAKTRNPYAYIPFSAGARNCIGQKFAMLEMKVILTYILRNFTIESLDPRDKVILCPEINLFTESEIRFKIHPRT